MANTTIRQLGDASSLKANDYLLIAQEDGTTKKVPLNRLISEGMVASDSSGETTMVTRAKIWVGHSSSLTDLQGVERSASNNWDDKSWNLIHPGRGNTPEDIKATDFCHFTAVDQPVPMFVLNRPFLDLHEAMTWARYNVPGGWDLQFDFVGSTHCFHQADKLHQFSPNFTGGMNLNVISFIPKHRFIGSYNSTTKVWDLGKAHPNDKWAHNRWAPDYDTAGGPNSTGVARSTYVTADLGVNDSACRVDRRMEPREGQAIGDVYIHMGGGSGLRIWFRDIPKIYISGLVWADTHYSRQIGNQRFFRVSNGRMHLFGENCLNLEAAIHVQANQRGVTFMSKHGCSTIFEVIEGGSVYIMCNIRHYSVGTTTSAWQHQITHHLSHMQQNAVALASEEALWHAAPKQIVQLARVGINDSGVAGVSTCCWDPLYHGWYRALGLITLDSNTLLYHNGTTLKSGGATNKANTSGTGFINWGDFNHHSWLVNAHGNINDPNWEHYDVDSLNWYYRGVTPTKSYTDGGTVREANFWNVAGTSKEIPWQGWKTCTVTNGGVFSECLPGVIKGQYISNGDTNFTGTAMGAPSDGDGTYSYFDARGFRHWQKKTISNTQVQALTPIPSEPGFSEGGYNFVQHYPNGKNCRIGATINSPCESAYSFCSADARIYLAKQYSTMNYIGDRGWMWMAEYSEFFNDQYGGGITDHSFHAAIHNGAHVWSLHGGTFPAPNTQTNSRGIFKYKNGNGSMDHFTLTSGEVKNWPIIGGCNFLNQSEYPGTPLEDRTGAAGVGYGKSYLHNMGTMGALTSTGTDLWGFPSLQFSHQQLKPGGTGSVFTLAYNPPGIGVEVVGEHNSIFPLETCYVNNGGVYDDWIQCYFIDLEARPAIHNFVEGINGRKQPYWWDEGTPYYYNQWHTSPYTPTNWGDGY